MFFFPLKQARFELSNHAQQIKVPIDQAADFEAWELFKVL